MTPFYHPGLEIIFLTGNPPSQLTHHEGGLWENVWENGYQYLQCDQLAPVLQSLEGVLPSHHPHSRKPFDTRRVILWNHVYTTKLMYLCSILSPYLYCSIGEIVCQVRHLLCSQGWEVQDPRPWKKALQTLQKVEFPVVGNVRKHVGHFNVEVSWSNPTLPESKISYVPSHVLH